MSEDGTTAAAPTAGDGSSADAEPDGRAPVGTDADDTYGGVLGAYPYAFRASDSRLFRSYAVIGGILTAAVVLIFGTALVTLVANTLGTVGGTFTFVRSFFLVVGLTVVVPLMAPVLLVARRHRRSVSTVEYDRAIAASGYLFVLSLYLVLIITAPPENRETPPALLAPVVKTLYALPPAAGVAPPLVAIAIGYLVHRRYR